jgi:hypothetical protein
MWGCGGIAAGAAGAGAAAAAEAGTAGAFGPAAAAVKARVNKSIAVIKSVKNPIFFMHFLLVRIPARTPPLKSRATDPLHQEARSTRTV